MVSNGSWLDSGDPAHFRHFPGRDIVDRIAQSLCAGV